MRVFLKIVLTTAFVLGVVLAMDGTVKAQGLRIAFIDDEKIKANYPEWVRAQEQWEIERRAWDDEAVTRQTELEELITEFEKQKVVMSEDKKKEREAAIRAKRDALDAYTRQIYGPGGTAEQKQVELIDPLLDKVNQAIRLVAEEENLDVVFTLQSGLGYIKETYEITDKVLEKLESIEE